MKHTQRGAISGGLIALIGVLVVVVGFAAVIWGQYTSAIRYGNQSEVQLKAIVENNQNIYAQGTQMVMEIAAVPSMYTEDLGKLIQQDVQGRYGKDGSKATMQWFKEHDVKLDVSMYTKIQQVIESFRNKFEVNQTRLVDVKRSYETILGNDYFLGQGWWLHIAGYPKIKLDEFKPITTTRTEQVFKAGKEDGPMKLR